MTVYLVRRVLLFIPSLLLASIAIFTAMRVLPGDVALVILGNNESPSGDNTQLLESYRQALGLHDPLPVQYARWMWSLVDGEWGGTSLIQHDPIGSIVTQRLPVTLELVILTFVLSWMVSIPLGTLAAFRHNRWPDYTVRLITIAGHAVPVFWAALLLLLIMSVVFSWTPPVFYSDLWADPRDNLLKVIWPALLLAWGFSAYLARVTRSSLLEVLRQDYILAARSKGLEGRAVATRHALRNALIPVLTVGGLQIGALLGGTVILENIFGIPGIGQEIVLAANSRDYPVIQSLAMLLVLLVLVLNLIIDVMYTMVDPRVRLVGGTRR
jgi:peptide/nickel transport system permease protein